MPVSQKMQSQLPGKGAPPKLPPPPAPFMVTWKDVACLGPIAIYIVYGYAALVLGPSLIGKNPLLLEALRGNTVAIIIGAAFAHVGRASILAVLLLPIPSLMVADPFLYWAGWRYGRRILMGSAPGGSKAEKRFLQMEHFFSRYGLWTIFLAYFLPLPTVLFYLAAGETHIPFWKFLAADLAGTLLWIGTNTALGWILGSRAVAIAQDISRYSLPVTIGLVVVLFGWALWQSDLTSGKPRQGGA